MNEANQLEKLIKHAEIAVRLQVDNLRLRTFAQIKEDVDILEGSGYSIPVKNRVVMTNIFINQLVTGDDTAAWVDAIWPEELKGSWDIAQPRLGHLDLYTAGGDDWPDRVETLAENFYESLISDAFLGVVANVHVGHEKERLEKLLSAFLIKHEGRDDDEEGIAPGPLSLLGPAVSVIKGSYALICPIPGKFGTQQSDVEYIMPEGRKQIAESFEKAHKAGKSLSVELDKPAWAQLKSEYKNARGVEASCCAKMMEFQKGFTDGLVALAQDRIIRNKTRKPTATHA